MIDPTGGDQKALKGALLWSQTPEGLRLRISELEVQLAREKDMHKASMRNVTALGGQLAAERKMRRLIEAQHVRLCDEVYEEDGETLKIVAERKAREDAEQRVATEQSQKQYLRDRLATVAAALESARIFILNLRVPQNKAEAAVLVLLQGAPLLSQINRALAPAPVAEHTESAAAQDMQAEPSAEYVGVTNSPASAAASLMWEVTLHNKPLYRFHADDGWNVTAVPC